MSRDQLPVVKITSAEWKDAMLLDADKRERAIFLPAMEIYDSEKHKYYVGIGLLHAMLTQQVKIACKCGVMCNFGQRARAPGASQSLFFVNCGMNRELKSRELECDFYGQLRMPSSFMWKHAQEIVGLGKDKYRLNPDHEETKKRKRDAEVAEKDLSLLWPCPVCGHKPPQWDKVTAEDRKLLLGIMEKICNNN